MPLAIVFPGQGAAFPGMGRPWFDHDAWRVVTSAEEVTGRPLAHLLLDATADELAHTDAGQLAVLLVSLMAHRAIVDHLQPDDVLAVAGHSLGQITALLATEAVDFASGLHLAAARADVCEASARRNPGRMAALIGATPEQARDVVDGSGQVWIANDNAPGQIVLAGRPDDLEHALQHARSVGVRRTQLLTVGHAFHTPLLTDAADAWRPTLAATPFHAPRHPIIVNTDATIHRDATGWPKELADHLVNPVRWRETQLMLAAMGTTGLLELGPGAVLSGLARRTVPDLAVEQVGTPDQAESFRVCMAELRRDRLASGAIG